MKYILTTFDDRTKVVVNDKKFNLACKFYEYIFEPVLARKSLIFYDANFHRFISHLLYISFYVKSDYAEEIFEDFCKLIKAKNDDGLKYLFSSQSLPNISPALDSIRIFCTYHRDLINEELDSLQGTAIGKWVLDLTDSSLCALLREWGQEFDQIEVFCDSSKPLQEQELTNMFQAMVGMEEKLFMDIAGKRHAISFNLASPPQLVDSQSRPGIQIADVFAGTFAFIFRENSKGNFSACPKEWMPHLERCISPYSVMPDIEEHLDLSRAEVKRNCLILEEMTQRSIDNVSLLDGIEIFIGDITRQIYMASLVGF